MDSNSPSPLKKLISKNRTDLNNKDIKFAISRSTIFSGKSNNLKTNRKTTSRNNLDQRSYST